MSKRRDREYTPEEAFAITLREVTPHWYRSDPLIVGVNENDTHYPQPLHASVQTGVWVFFFASATSPVFDRALAMLRIWERRFVALGVRFVFGFRGHYPYFNERKAIEAWLTKFDLGMPCVCDYDGELAKSFGAKGEPAIAVLKDGKILYSGSADHWLESAESTLQTVLRETSPGLPLWPIALEEGKPVREMGNWELRQGSDALKNSQVELVGTWVIEEDRVTTTDPKAELRFKAPGGAIDLVGRSLSDSGDPTRIRFDTHGASFSDEFAGKDFVVDDEGNSSLILGGPRGYSALRRLPPNLRQLRFRFPFAKVSPVALYGIEFGD